jgi:prepilin-type N-terminal cleavage/methylation domain-containing protein
VGKEFSTVDGARDRGFTLVELLIVIVILGVLAVVAVFAVRGIVDRGEENACATDLRTLTGAQEAHWLLHGSYATEPDLVSAGMIREVSPLYDVTLVGADGYSIAPAAGSGCTGTTTGGDTAPSPPAPAPSPPGPVAPSPVNFGGYAGWEYGASGADEIVVFGGATGEFDWLTMINAGPPTSRRVTFIPFSVIADSGDVDAIMSRSRTNGVTDFALYPADDTAPLPLDGGGDAPSVEAYLVSQLAGDPYRALVGPGNGIAELIADIG